MKELIDDLKKIEKQYTDIATRLRTEDPKSSYAIWKTAESCRKAAEELERLIPAPAEIEGGGTSWFYVCGKCNKAINYKDKYCRECGREVKWE